ncbi:MAG: hypothetical protein ACP5ID_05600 [Conexivisphaera sp.]
MEVRDEVRRLMEEAGKLVAYKHTFLPRRTYLMGIIDEKLRSIAERLEYYGLDGQRYIEKLEDEWRGGWKRRRRWDRDEAIIG